MMNRYPMKAQTSSRQIVLDRVTGHPIEGPELPSIDHTLITHFDDPLTKFQEILSSVGGQSHVLESPDEVMTILSEVEVFQNARRICSVASEFVTGNFDASSIEDPHHLDSLDWVIARGEFGVAENGAIWVSGTTLPHRVMLFLTQYLAIIVPKDKIFSNLHEAYDRINDPGTEFGIFVSGPSKTADIEQSLVLGAHGCRKLQVFLV